MGRKLRSVTKAALILLGVVSAGCTAGYPGYVPTEVQPALGALMAPNFGSLGHQEPLTELSLTNRQEWIETKLFPTRNRSSVRLPNYAYLQGLVQAKEHVSLIGQVRVVGGVLGVETGVAAFYDGAMVTANPYAFTYASKYLTGGSGGFRTRIGSMQEVATPLPPMP